MAYSKDEIYELLSKELVISSLTYENFVGCNDMVNLKLKIVSKTFNGMVSDILIYFSNF